MFFIYCTLIEHLQLHFFSTITAFDLALEKVPVQLELNTAGKGQQTSIPTLQSNFFYYYTDCIKDFDEDA